MIAARSIPQLAQGRMQKQHIVRMLWIGIVAALLLAACGGRSASGTQLEQNGPNPSPQLTLEEADQVAQTFLSAWQAADYGAMYSLITPNSRDAFGPEAFTAQYENLRTLFTLQSLDTQIVSSLREGTTAAILYDVTFHSERFGAVMDSGRLLRLIETPEGWRVAWSLGDIFAAMQGGGRLELRQVLPGRGNIYDRNGNVLVDQNGRAITIFAVKRDMPDVAQCITALARILDREEVDLQEVFDRYAPEIRFRVGEITPEKYQAEEQTLRQVCDVGDDPGDTQTRPTRRYFGTLAPHVVGYVGPIRPDQMEEYTRRGYPPDALIGQEGIERSYETVLAGTIGGQLVVASAGGEILRVVAEIAAEPGQSVYLTIDRDLQQALQEAIVDAYRYAGPTWAITSPGAAAVVLDVDTGEVLAMVSYPWFDPSVFNPDSGIENRDEQVTALENNPRTPLLNRATQGAFASGSVFKIVTLTAGLDSGVYTPGAGVTCSGIWYGGQYGDWLNARTDWLRTGHGWVDARRALTYSCNPYFWQLGVALHNEDPTLLERYAHEMGLGVPTGQTDIPEAAGQIPNDALVFRLNGRGWQMADTLNLVIGQGETLNTPLQIARMVAAVANGGTLYTPQFVHKIQLISEEPSYIAAPEIGSQLDVDPAVLALVRNAMCDVTLDPNGTARYIFESWYDFQGEQVIVCGKTGTAQIGSTGIKPQAWFTAFAPQDDPEIAIAVIVENSCEGSEVAAPLARRIVEDYYGMPHSDWPSFWQSACFDLGE